LITQVEQVVYDVKNESVLYLLPALVKQHEDDVLKLSIRNQNGVMEIVSIFKVKQLDISAGIQSGQYEVVK
jgi:hypothetical protein